MRIEKIVIGSYYHIFLRGNNKRDIFHDDKDYIRFIFLLLFSQSPLCIARGNVGHYVSQYTRHSVFSIRKKTVEDLVKNRYVELVNFTLMPNHFHLTVYEKDENGIARYMQKILNAYTKYYNARYDTTGHLFAGPYQYRRVKDDNHLSYLSAYIHYNQRGIREWRNKEHLYPWSSFQDYAVKSRWGDILQNKIIMQKFSNKKDYKEFVIKSGAKAHLGADNTFHT